MTSSYRPARSGRCASIVQGAVFVILLPLRGSLLGPLPAARADGTSLRWETFAGPLIEGRCSPCHGWTSYQQVYQYRSSIFDFVSTDFMPPVEPLPEADKAQLLEWIACGLPYDGPPCAGEGTSYGYRSFEGLLVTRCGGCHASQLEGEDRFGAPPGQDWDVPAAVSAHAGEIIDSIRRCTMPPADAPPWLGRWCIEEHLNGPLMEWLACGAPARLEEPLYRRGDANGDGATDLSDAMTILRYLFSGNALVDCRDAGDVDADGVLSITDAIYILRYSFLGGPPPRPPFEACGVVGPLGCDVQDVCG